MSESGPDLLNDLAYEFAERFRRGEHPSLTEYTDRYPGLEAEIRDLFPALAVIEQFGSVAGPPTDPHGQSATADGAMPQQLGEYRILREVARGGMGIVYEAVQESLGRHVALKVLPFQSLASVNDRERFRREAQAAARLHHTNIVPIFGVGEDTGVHYFAMQFIQGQALNSVLHELRSRRRSQSPPDGDPAEDPSSVPAGRRTLELTVTLAEGLMTGQFRDDERRGNRPDDRIAPQGDPAGPTTDEPGSSPVVVSGDVSELGEQSESNYFRSVARVGVQVAEGLEHAHKQGIVHRDIKPSNLLLDHQGTVWITDFGLAKAEGTDELTGPGDLLGTLRYMAPERFQGQADPRSDIFSLGLTLYEMVTLRPAFPGAGRAQLIERMLHAQPPRPRQLDDAIPRDLETIILKAIAREPARRYQTAGDLAADLQRFLADRPIRARRSTPAELFVRWCRRNPWLAGANIAAALLTTILAIGSTLAAWAFHDQRDLIGRSLRHIQEAETRGRERLLESLTAQASARRHGRQMGQRFDSLDALAQAAAIARELKRLAGRLDPLRDEAIACLALPDLKPVGRVFQRPPGVVTLTFDSTMTRSAWRFRDGTIVVRRAADDREVARFRARGDREIAIFGFSPDGRYLATTHHPGFGLTVWDIDRRAVSLDDPGPVAGIPAARFSPDSRRIAVGHQDGGLLVHDLATGNAVRRWPGLSLWVPVFKPDGTQIAFLEKLRKDRACRIVDAESGAPVRSFPLPDLSWTWLDWSHDGTTLAMSCDDGKIFLWDAVTGLRKAMLDGNANFGVRAVFHPAGTLLSSDGWDWRMRLWDPVLGRPVLGATGGLCRDFNKDGRVVLLLGDQVRSYEVDPALEYVTLAHAADRPIVYQCAAIRHDGRVLAVGTNRGLALWDLAHRVELPFLPIGMTRQAIFQASGDLLTSGSIGVRRWPVQLEPDRGEFRIGPPLPLPLPSTDCRVAADRMGRILAIPDHDYAFVATPDRTIHVGPLDDCRSTAVSPDGEWLATGSHVGTKGAQVWRIRDTTKVAELPVDHGTEVAFSSDGKWLMTMNAPCRLWAVGAWGEPRPIGDQGLCFSPDGRLAAVEDATGVIRLVDIESGRTVARLESPGLGHTLRASFSPDGSRLVIATHEPPAVHVWDLRAIRRHLSGIGLDWDAPAYSEDDPADPSAPPLPTLQVDLGPLPLAVSVDPGSSEPLIGELEARLVREPGQSEIRARLARRCNVYAWDLANATGANRDPERALSLARRSVELAPNAAAYLNTLGVAQYRAGRHAEAVATLERSLAAGHGQYDGFDLFFLAMAHWQLGDKARALDHFNKAALWMEKNLTTDEELVRFRAEAAALLRVNDKEN